MTEHTANLQLALTAERSAPRAGASWATPAPQRKVVRKGFLRALLGLFF